MADWPLPQNIALDRGILSPWNVNMALGGTRVLGNTGFAAATWTAQRAVFLPVVVNSPGTVTALHCEVTTQAGNYNMGIYEEDGSATVRGTKASVPAAGIGTLDITDTLLMPGTYYLGLWCDSSTAAFSSFAAAVGLMRACGAQQQTSLASDLPATATFATYATAVAPFICGTWKATY